MMVADALQLVGDHNIGLLVASEDESMVCAGSMSEGKLQMGVYPMGIGPLGLR